MHLNDSAARWPARARVGLMVPASNTAAEGDLRDGLPPDVGVHTARMLLDDVTAEAERRMVAKEAPRAAQELRNTCPDLVVFACTSAEAVLGVTSTRLLIEQLAQIAATPVIAAYEAVTEAIQARSPRRVAILTPYTDEVNRHVADFAIAVDIPVKLLAGMGLTSNEAIGGLTVTDLADFGERHLNKGAFDLVFLSCTNLRTVPCRSQLEKRWGIPVVTSNSACIEAALTRLHDCGAMA